MTAETLVIRLEVGTTTALAISGMTVPAGRTWAGA